MHADTSTIAADSLGFASELLSAAAEVFGSLLSRLHPAWTRVVGADPDALATVGPALWADVVAERFDLRWPDLSAATQALELLWLLPPAQVQRVCCARVLFAARGALRRTVDASARRAARALLGSPSFDALMAAAAPARGGAQIPPLLDAAEVGVAGWSMLQSESTWPDPKGRRLVQLMLPPIKPAGPSAAAPTPDEAALFRRGLPTFFPEHAWLFGSSPASMNSA